MGNVKKRKFDESNPNIKAVRKYQMELAALQEKYDKANYEQDWSMRHFYGNQIQAKKANMDVLIQKLYKRYPSVLNLLEC